MSENLKDYFYFSRSEKNGIIVLLAILLSLIIMPYLYSIIQLPENQVQQKFNEEVSLFANSLKKSSEPEYTNKLDQYIIERYDSLELFFLIRTIPPKRIFINWGSLRNKQQQFIITLQKVASSGLKMIFERFMESGKNNIKYSNLTFSFLSKTRLIIKTNCTLKVKKPEFLQPQTCSGSIRTQQAMKIIKNWDFLK
jgi:hypothetical protein